MANSDKSGDLKVTFTKDFRKKLLCKKCEKLPRPGIELMRCGICREILCGNCCSAQCPLCYEKFPIFIKESELMEVLSGFKTHPCMNLKNGCFEEIAAKLDDLRAHDQSCAFQKVPCPDCEEAVIFKDLGQHLKQAHVKDSISIYYGTEINEYTHRPGIFGIYNLQADLINGRKYYKNGKYAISWDGERDWYLGLNETEKGKSVGYAHLKKDVQNLHNTTDWMLAHSPTGGWEDAGEMLRVKGSM